MFTLLMDFLLSSIWWIFFMQSRYGKNKLVWFFSLFLVAQLLYRHGLSFCTTVKFRHSQTNFLFLKTYVHPWMIVQTYKQALLDHNFLLFDVSSLLSNLFRNKLLIFRNHDGYITKSELLQSTKRLSEE